MDRSTHYAVPINVPNIEHQVKMLEQALHGPHAYAGLTTARKIGIGTELNEIKGCLAEDNPSMDTLKRLQDRLNVHRSIVSYVESRLPDTSQQQAS